MLDAMLTAGHGSLSVAHKDFACVITLSEQGVGSKWNSVVMS